MRWIPLTVLALAALPGASAAPVPKHLVKDPLYMPTTVGTTWVYDVGGKEETFVITKAEDDKGTKLISIDQVVGGKSKPYAGMAVSAAGLTQVSDSGVAYDEPALLLRRPVEAGDYWSPNYSREEPKRKVIEIKQLKTPAGAFMAVHIECSSRGGVFGPGLYHEWYTPEIGVVKMILNNGTEKVLKSFTLGKN